MAEPATAFGAALLIVSVAEFADKTQLALVAMTGRGRALPVYVGAVAAFTVLSVAAAWLGAAVGDRLPLRWVAVVAGLAFIVLGVLGLRRREEAEATGPEQRPGRPRWLAWARSGAAGAFVLILLAELGDRTQIAIVALAARNGHPWWTAAGAALALAGVAAITVALGAWVRTRVPVEKVERAAAWLFIVVGVLFVVTPWLL